MNVTKKTEVTYTLTDINADQAQDLLDLCVCDATRVLIDIRDPVIEETLNNIRQALVLAGVRPTNVIEGAKQ